MKLRVVAKIPKKLLDPDKILKAVENALDGAALAAKADFLTTTETWSAKSKPDFKISRGKLLRTVFTTGTIYAYVDEGTPPHKIIAKRINPKTGNIMPLAFKVPYVAKTAPKVIASGPGGSGSIWQSGMEIDHPGTKPREFAETIQEKWQDELPKQLQRAIDAEVE